MNIASPSPRAALPHSWRTRAKPLLGTIVNISLPCAGSDGEAAFVEATDFAFWRIEAIHRAMSFHEATSDVRAIASAAPGDVITVSPDTWKTLFLAAEIERESLGVFNVAIAPELVARGLLPTPGDLPKPAAVSTLALSIALEAGDQIRVLQHVWIDLGGIAKGYAVDAAAASLRGAGVTAGVVNAGGDLCVFGSARHRLALRVPAAPAESVEVAELQDLSCATSGAYFSADANSRANLLTLCTHPAIVGNRARSMAKVASVSVIASSCVIADALTKVVWLRGTDDPMCADLLKRHGASVVLLDAMGVSTTVASNGN